MTRLTILVSVPLAAIMSVTPGLARDRQPAASAKLFDDMLQCRSISEAGARLACFYKQAAAIGAAAARNEVAVIDKESVRKTERQQFGLAESSAVELKSPADAGDESLDAIQSTIVSFQPALRDRWRLQLADGSEWLTLEAIAYRVPEANMAVTVKKAALGTYLLRPSGWPAVRAKRVK